MENVTNWYKRISLYKESKEKDGYTFYFVPSAVSSLMGIL